MKKTVILLGILTVSMLAMQIGMDAFSNTGGSSAGKTGSPGDGANCTQCHSGSPQQQPGLITTNIPGGGYTPGFIYQITATIVDSTSTKFGFQVSPQNVQGTRLGTLIATNTTETQTQQTGKYITHKTAGTPGVGMRTWTFDWQAPAPGTGNVTFYGAFNVANSNNLSSGDRILLSTTQVSEDLSSIGDQVESFPAVKLFPNPASEFLLLDLGKQVNESVEIRIVDLRGRVVKEEILEPENGQSLRIEVSALATGVYFISIENKGNTTTRRFVKD
jgi:hypothetical protein